MVFMLAFQIKVIKVPLKEKLKLANLSCQVWKLAMWGAFWVAVVEINIQVSGSVATYMMNNYSKLRITQERKMYCTIQQSNTLKLKIQSTVVFNTALQPQQFLKKPNTI